MAPPKLPPRIVDVEVLAEPFLPMARAIVAGVVAADLPMVVRETRRSIRLQDYYFSKGWTEKRGAKGPHPWGLAIDMVLDPKDARWAKLGERPVKAVDGGAADFDTGYELLPSGPTLVRPVVASVWRRYGEIVRASGAEWGGDWSRKIPAPYEFGWDCPHGQHPRWFSFIGKVPPPPP